MLTWCVDFDQIESGTPGNEEVRVPVSRLRIIADTVARVEASATQIYGTLLTTATHAGSLKAEIAVLQNAKRILRECTGEDPSV